MTRSGSFGFDPARLARIDRMLKRDYLDTGILPHASLLIGRGNAIAHRFMAGDARPGAPVAEDSIFRIASMTKPITSVVFMQLVEEGRVSLNEAVTRILPEWARLGVRCGGGGSAPFLTRPATHPMRMVDLLRHTAGLTYSFQDLSYIDAAYRKTGIEKFDTGDLEAFVGTLATLPLEYDPGTRWIYSVATDVLGAIIQRVEGKPLDRVFEDRIFQPLGMKDTHFQLPLEKADRLPDCYVVAPQGRKLYDAGGSASAWAKPPKLLSGGGGLLSTIDDYHRFCRMLRNGGELEGARILSPHTLNLMTSNHLPGGADLAGIARGLFSETDNSGVGFGLGFATVLNPASTLMPGHAGEYYWGGIFSTSFTIDPVADTILIFMTQLMPSSATEIRRVLRTMLYAALVD